MNADKGFLPDVSFDTLIFNLPVPPQYFLFHWEMVSAVVYANVKAFLNKSVQMAD